jgi:hypothetical protein
MSSGAGRYVASVNTPGYLPMDDDPPMFATAREAWEYLAGERDRSFDHAETDPDSEDIWHWMVATAQDPGESDTGTVYGDTPGYDGAHDLGLAYSVTFVPADELRAPVNYPHHPGRLYDCAACEASCHCTPGNAECVYDGEHNGTAVTEGLDS